MQKANRMLTPCGGVQPLFHIPRSSTSNSRPLRPNPARSHSLPILTSSSRCKRRTYATETSLETSPSTSHPDLSWPTTNPANPYELPTPYAIFKMQPAAPYSKRRFYELVKLYHPDTQQLDTRSRTPLSADARLQRYRMVIAANELLSDPRKRRLYDTQGLGWSGRPGFGAARPAWEYDGHNSKKGGWTGFEDNGTRDDPRNNATWEDWEEWQMRRERTEGEQRPVYMNNGAFVVLICVAAGGAAMAEGSRAGSTSRSFLEQVEARHAGSSQDLMRRRAESQESEGRDERLRGFLRARGIVEGEVERTPVGQEREGSLFVEEGHEGGPKKS